ncbi:hypothetical protein PMAYCL1PPCAC_25757, partial [Pristionchus mayeri]
PLSLSQLQVASQESAKSSLQPERIDSTISSVPTLGKSDPSFRPSQCSQSTTDSEEEEEIDTESPVRSKYFLVDKANLEQLFRRCQECGGIIDPTSVCWKQKASALWATYQCTECKKWGRWDNQPKRGSGRSQVHELNQSIPVAAFITGTPIARLLDLFELLGIGVPSERSMRDSVRFYACPAIDRVFAVWERDARDLSKEAAPYPTLDFIIRERVTDSNASVDKRIRENPKLSGIESRRDFWHVQKPLRKAWWDGMKKPSCRRLAQWYKPFFNHLYYTNDRFPKLEDRPLALEHARSFLKHCTGEHTWKKDDEFKLVTQCNHATRRVTKKGIKKGKAAKKDKKMRQLIEKDSPEYRLIHSLLFSPAFEKAFLKCSADAGTAMCESYHSLSLMYAPKRLSRAAPYYNKKMKLSAMHHNSLVFSELLGDRVEIGQVLLPRKGRIADSVKRKTSKGKHPWRDEIMEESWILRDVYEGNRYLKRIGAPDDDHFDQLKVIYDRMVRGEEESDEEEEDIEGNQGDSD